MLRDEVLKALEEARNAKVIGKSLEAKVLVYADSNVAEIINDEAVNFGQISIVSQLQVAGNKEDAPENALVLDKTIYRYRKS